jgi:ribonuclease VapC
VIVDSSALVEVALGEAGAAALLAALAHSGTNRISAANLLETWMVVDRRGVPEALPILADTIMRAALDVEPVTFAQVEIAREAWARYGKGSGHPAQLNFGDCFAYALAKHLDEPLLFIGNDFAHTDIQTALEAELTE